MNALGTPMSDPMTLPTFRIPCSTLCTSVYRRPQRHRLAGEQSGNSLEAGPELALKPDSAVEVHGSKGSNYARCKRKLVE